MSEAMKGATGGGRVREILRQCEAMGLDRRRLALALAVSPRTVRRWEEGEGEPNEASLRALSRLAAIHDLAVRLFAEGAAREWFEATNENLVGERPLAAMLRGDFHRVRDLLGMMSWGIDA